MWRDRKKNRRRKTLKKNENKIQSEKYVDRVEPYGILIKVLSLF